MAGTNQEEILLRMGFAMDAVQRGTVAMLDQQKKAAQDYVGFWKKAITDKEQAEMAADVRSASRANKARALLRERAVVQAGRQALTDAEIAAGTIPAGWAAQAARRTAARDLEAAAAGAAGGAAAHGAGSLFRHLISFFRELASGEWTRAAGSATSMLSRFGLALSSLPVIGAGIAGIIGNWKMRGALNEMAGGYGTIKGTEGTEGILRGRLSTVIDNLVKSGKISESQADIFKASLASGGLSAVKSVSRDLSQYMPKGAESAKDIATMQRLDEEHRKNLLAYNREELGTSGKLTFDQIHRHILMGEMAAMDKDSVEYKQKQLELDAAGRDILKDQRDITEEKKNLEKEMAGLARQRKDMLTDESKIGQESPTLAMLAGGRFTSQLSKDYGPGGRFDLSAGDGPFAGVAQEAQLAQKQQLWDIVHGNAVFDKNGALIGGGAFEDRQRQIAAENKLSAAGLETPAMKLAKMQEHLGDINNNIADLLARAKHDGINIADSTK